jgi:hypothetical protein
MQRLWLAPCGLAFYAVLTVGCMKAGAPPGVPTIEVPVARVDGSQVAVGAHADAPHAGADSDGRSPGDHVEVEWHGSWFPATLLERRGDRWFIHYDRFGDEWDEVVERDRIRTTLRPADEDVGEDDGDP